MAKVNYIPPHDIRDQLLRLRPYRDALCRLMTHYRFSSAEYRRLTDHFALSLPEKRSVSPVTGTNWQGVGVKPDVPAPADRALEVALDLARAELKRRAAAS